MRNWLTLLPCLLLLAGCRKDDITTEAVGCGEPGPVGYKVFIRPVTDTLRNGTVPPGTYLLSHDGGAYPSISYELVTTLQQQGNTLNLSYCDVKMCQVCLGQPGPANSSVSLRHLPPQVYQLNITVRQRRTTGTLDLTVTPARLTIADTTVAAVR